MSDELTTLVREEEEEEGGGGYTHRLTATKFAEITFQLLTINNINSVTIPSLYVLKFNK